MWLSCMASHKICVCRKCRPSPPSSNQDREIARERKRAREHGSHRFRLEPFTDPLAPTSRWDAFFRRPPRFLTFPINDNTWGGAMQPKQVSAHIPRSAALILALSLVTTFGGVGA